MLAMTVAPAEPAAPQPNTWMKSGLRQMLMRVPATEPTAEGPANPSVRRRLVGVIDTMMKGEPRMISE